MSSACALGRLFKPSHLMLQGPTWKDIGSRTALKPSDWMRYMTVRKSCVDALGPCQRPCTMLLLVSNPNLRSAGGQAVLVMWSAQNALQQSAARLPWETCTTHPLDTQKPHLKLTSSTVLQDVKSVLAAPYMRKKLMRAWCQVPPRTPGRSPSPICRAPVDGLERKRLAVNADQAAVGD